MDSAAPSESPFPIRFLISLSIAVSSGFIFTWLHLPIPWLLGPMTGMLLGTQLFKLQLAWPAPVRDYGILLVGYSIGLTMTAEALHGIVRQLPIMLIMTFLLLGLCTLTAFIASKITEFDFPSLLVGSVPGGLSQMVTLAEEMKPLNLTVITFLQVIRLLMIVFVVPFLLFSPWVGGMHSVGVSSNLAASWASLFPGILIYVPLCAAGAWLARKLHFPTAFMLGPMLVMAIAQATPAPSAPELPASLLNLSQLMIGSHVGLMLKLDQLQRKKQTILLGLTSSALLIAGALFLSYTLMKLFSHSAATSLLSMAPGGLDQMSIMAHEVNADLSVVSGYQLFRLLFIFLIVSPLLKVIIARMLKSPVNKNQSANAERILESLHNRR